MKPTLTDAPDAALLDVDALSGAVDADPPPEPPQLFFELELQPLTPVPSTAMQRGAAPAFPVGHGSLRSSQGDPDPGSLLIAP
jgi:hypothetical protein